MPSDAEELAELRAVQEFMAGALFRPLTSDDRMQSKWTDGRPMSKAVAEVIKPNDRLTSFERLELYNRGYWFRILDCLYEDFPAVRTVIGQRRFHKIITAFLAEFPSESYTLRDLGQRFPAFIQGHAQFTAPHSAMAAEAAAFEWAHVVAFDGEAKPGLGVDSFLGVDPGTLRLALQPYLTLMELQYPWDDFVLGLRDAEEEGRGTASNTVAEATVRKSGSRNRRPNAEQCKVVVHRHRNSVYYKRVQPAAFAILRALRDGETLAEACAAGVALAEPGSEFGSELQKWFHDWAALGWLCERD